MADTKQEVKKQTLSGPIIFLAIISVGFYILHDLSKINSASRAPIEEKTFKNIPVIVENSEFQYMSDPVVNIWRSYEDRTLVAKIYRGDKVTLSGWDQENNYCQITTPDFKVGWASCEWFQKLPK
jgi:hypothetical protein